MSEHREVTAKIVFYGPGLSGKTTNLKKVYAMLKEEARGKLMALSTQSDRTIFFDYLPVNLGAVRGMHLKIQLYTVPGQVFYNSTRRLVLKNVDGVVFVADSSRRALPDNLESLTNLQENLKLYGKSLDVVPWVLQYNKRDLPEALPLATLREKLNRWEVPEFEAAAKKGKGIMETLAGITKLVVKNLRVQPLEERPALHSPEEDDKIPVEVKTPSLTVPTEKDMASPRVPGALTDNELTSTVSDDTLDYNPGGETAVSEDSANPAVHELSLQEKQVVGNSSSATARENRDQTSVGPDPVMAVNIIEEETHSTAFGEDGALPEIDIEEDFETLDDVEEIEPLAEVQIRSLTKPRWRNGTLIVPLEIKVGDSEFLHELAIHLDPIMEEPTNGEE